MWSQSLKEWVILRDPSALQCVCTTQWTVCGQRGDRIEVLGIGQLRMSWLNSRVTLGRFLAESWIGVVKSAYHQLSHFEIGSDNPCQLNRSTQHSSNLLIRLCFSKRPDPLGCTQLNLNRAVFSLNQRSRTNLAVETPDWTFGRCCVDPLRPSGLSLAISH
jgi:hypothetical protein